MIFQYLKPEEQEEIEHFRVHLLTSKAEGTTNVYLFYVAKFMIFIRKYYTPGNLQYVINKMLSEEIATGQVARAAIKSYLTYKNVTEPYTIPKNKRRKRIIHACPESAVPKILGFTSGIANKVLIKITWKGALRNKEAVSLQVKNIIFDPPRRIVVIGKGDKERNVYINDETANMIHDYINEMGLTKPDDYLFEKIMNLKHPTRHFRYIMAKASKKVLGEKISPHKLRHGRATKMLEDGVPLQIIQKFLGHASIETTTEYAHVNDNMMIKELQKSEPEENYSSNKSEKKETETKSCSSQSKNSDA